MPDRDYTRLSCRTSIDGYLDSTTPPGGAREQARDFMRRDTNVD